MSKTIEELEQELEGRLLQLEKGILETHRQLKDLSFDLKETVKLHEEGNIIVGGGSEDNARAFVPIIEFENINLKKKISYQYKPKNNNHFQQLKDLLNAVQSQSVSADDVWETVKQIMVDYRREGIESRLDYRNK